MLHDVGETEKPGLARKHFTQVLDGRLSIFEPVNLFDCFPLALWVGEFEPAVVGLLSEG